MIKIIRLNRSSVSTVSHPYSALQVFHHRRVVIDRFPVDRLAQLLPVKGPVTAGIFRRFHGLEVLLIEFRVEFTEGGKGAALRRLLRIAGGRGVIVGGAKVAGNSWGIVLKAGVAAASAASAERNIDGSHRRRHVSSVDRSQIMVYLSFLSAISNRVKRDQMRADSNDLNYLL